MDNFRKEFHEFMREKIAEDEENDTVLVGWVLIYEGAHADGKRSLNILSSEVNGEQDITPWASQGYLKYAMDTDMLLFESDFNDDEGGDDE